MKKQIKYFLVALLLFVLAGTGVVNAAEFDATDENIAETDSEELIYVIGTHLFTEETPYISTQIMMYAARTIDVPDGIEGEDALEYMKVYCRDLAGNWVDAITGEAVDLSGVKFDIQYKDLEKYIVTTADVKNVTELEEALADPYITTINLVEGDKFETDHSIIVSKPVTLNGNGQEITFTGDSGTWREDTQNYVIKVYNTEATIKDLVLTGANAGLQINASKVTLEGTIDVSGNAFGGIEVSKGVAEGLNNPQLIIADGAKIVNEDETVTTPTIWEDEVNDCLTGGNLVKVTGVKVGQVFYFNEMPEVNVTSVEELEHALQTNLEVINLTKSFETDHVIVVGRAVTINGNKNTITYEGETGSWSGGTGDNYVMQVYNAEATIKDIGLTGTSAGLLVNASTVTLEGTIDVSGNVFGGIEVSKGTAEGLNNPQLIVSEGATLVNDNESLASPTIWEDGVDNCVTTDLIKIEDAKEGEDQNFYFNESPIADVANVTELEAALSNARKEIINITENFTTDHVIVVGRAVTINGNKNTITYEGETGSWSGGTGDNYVMQVYNTEATIKDIGLTGTSAGLLVNASTVTLEGTIDVSGNVFGGIEVSKGTAEGLNNPQLIVSEGAKLVNDNESLASPTIWEDGVDNCVTTDLIKIEDAKEGEDQNFYFNESPIADVANVTELEAALSNTRKEIINITEDFTTDHVIVVGREVTINGNKNTITYNGETGSWSGGSGDNYVMQVYNAEATIKDIGLTGTSAGLLVNASTVTLEGTIDVSGNVFGGIEVSKGTEEGLNNPELIVAEGATIVNENESLSIPTIWEDGVDNCVTTNLIKIENAKEGADQNFYFNVSPIADVANVTDLEEAIKNENIEVINLTPEVIVEEPINLNKKVTINGNGATLAEGLNITGNDVTIKDVVINDKVTVSGENAILDEIEIKDVDTGYTNSKLSGVALIKVDTEGEFTLTNSKISNVTGTAYNLINVKTPSAVIIENNVFGENATDLAGIYNLIEFGQGENEEVKDGTIIRNNVFNTKSGNNTISMFKIEDGATITIENNTFAFSNNAMRLSNYNDASATFNIYDNTILSGTTDNFGGFICFQAVGKTAPAHAETYFANYTINVKNLIGTDGQKINTIEGEGTGANRLGYYYADYTADNSMPDSAKAKVNFIEE